MNPLKYSFVNDRHRQVYLKSVDGGEVLKYTEHEYGPLGTRADIARGFESPSGYQPVPFIV